jgi:methylglutaconyl-CoA hydratase
MTRTDGGPGGRAVRYEPKGRIGVIVLNRPERANAVSMAMRDQLHSTKEALARDPAVRVVVVTGAGRHFCGGADLTEPAAERAAARRRHPGATDFSGLPQPVIAAINGAAMGGGCELALTCDFRFMAAGAQIGLSEIRFGELPLGGGTVRLPRLVGPAAARRIIMTGEPVSAHEALRIGLVDFVQPPGELLAGALAFAERLAGHAGYALRAAKTLLNSALETDLATSLRREHAVVGAMPASGQAGSGPLRPGPGPAHPIRIKRAEHGGDS